MAARVLVFATRKRNGKPIENARQTIRERKRPAPTASKRCRGKPRKELGIFEPTWWSEFCQLNSGQAGK